MNAASQGEKALADSNAPLAIQHFTRALTELPRAPKYYIHRSTAYSRLKPADGGPNRVAALRDAEIAVFLARERGNRELILSAQMRRGIILFQLERYGDAHFIFEKIEAKAGTGQPVDKSEGLKNAMAGGWTKKDGYSAELPIWMAKVRRKLSELSEAESNEKIAVTVLEYPDVRVPTEKELKAEWERLKSGKSVTEGSSPVQPAAGVATSPAESKVDVAEQKSTSTPVVSEKVRHEWYQSTTSVVVTLYVKNVPKDQVQTELNDDSVSLEFPLPSGSAYDFTLDPLYAPINTSTSKVTVMGTKIEIVLEKKTPGQKWSALEALAGAAKISDRPSASTAPPASAPAYPTSSRHGTKDWDKVATSLTAKKPKENKPKGEEKKGSGDDSDAESVDSEFGGDAVDGFFKKLYAGADPDTRRAMMKSYVESNGTSLSTNWNEVGTKTMEPHPPK
ncbi:hypothetical protein N7520_006994 [Penicillium odoratum]|uniref:uncharacterized protein n=1 Tax=Penicillium odoratum TaxID=1167516 RepID=UPI002546F180|nr:uncharacterized protein N7520_006994 [Penicillium odoratum]KAJ5759838.1 hypothetical protein N7520_006994 [Penicillium odoratum]